ncbi:MAG: hypothetical protein WC511_02985 [Candidatus Pacearchaeota archaeon]
MAAKLIFPLSAEIMDSRRILGDAENLHGKVDSVKLKTDNLPADTASTLSTLSSDLATVDTVVDAIKVKTDNLPANTATTLSGIETKIDTVDTVVDAIKVKTDNLPVDTATVLSTIDTVVDAIKVKTDNLPADTATTLSGIETKIDTVDTVVDAIKVKTDNLPANTATTLSGIETKIDTVDTVVDGIATDVNAIETDVNTIDSNVGVPAALGGGTATVSGMLASIAGSGFTASDSLKDVKAAVMSIHNNTSFTASVVPIMEKPETGSNDYQALVNVYDGDGHLIDADLQTGLVKVLNSAGTSRNDKLFNDAAQTGAATKLSIHTITAPSTAPTAGATYEDSNNTVLTVIGMIGTTKLIASWTGVTEPVTGTLTKLTGTGDATLTSSAVDNSYVRMHREGTGQYHTFYNVLSTDTKESLAFRFAYFETGLFHAYDRASAIQDYEATATISGEVWDVLTTAHTTAGSYGLLVSGMAGTGFVASTDSLHALKGRLDTIDTTLSTISGKVDTVDTIVDAIKVKTDNLPADTAAALTSIEGKVDVVDTNVDAIKAKTDNLPANTSTTLSGIETKVDTVDTVVDAIKVKTDNLPANTSTVLGTPANGSLAADIADVKSTIQSQPSYPTTFEGTKATASLAQSASETLEFSTAEGMITNNAQMSQLKISVTGASSNFKVEIFEKTGGANKIYEVQQGDFNGLNLDLNGQIFRNKDNTPINKVYIKITNVADAGNSTFSTEFRGIVNA